MPGWTLGELARLVGGEVEGDAGVTIRDLASLEGAGDEDLSFVVSRRYLEQAEQSRAAAFLLPPGVAVSGRPAIRVAEPYGAVARLLTVLHPQPVPSPGVHWTACLAATARVAPEATVRALAVIGADSVVDARAVVHPHVVVGERCRIGEDSVLYPHVVLREDVIIGRRVVIHAGAVLGADGFGYAFDGAQHRKIPQVGRVVVEDDVEIGANVTIDRATFGETVIGRGTKIDNLVQIGHNTVVGADSIIVAQTGISGSCRIGNHVILGGQVGLADHATIGDGARVGAQAGVHGTVEAGATLMGSPALPAATARRVWASLPRVPALLRTVRRLEKRVTDLERRLRETGSPAR